MKDLRQYPLVRGVRIDINALRVLAHRCVPTNCSVSRNCCKTYEVLVDAREVSAIVGAMPDAARYAPGLYEDGIPIEPVEDAEHRQTCLATDEDGLCVFAYRNRAGATLCSLHSAALDLGLPPIKVKPKACVLWPLFLVETNPPLLTVQSDATEFACNKLRARAGAKLDQGVGDIIRAVFGEVFLGELEALLR